MRQNVGIYRNQVCRDYFEYFNNFFNPFMQNEIFDYVRIYSLSEVTKSNLLLLIFFEKILIVANNAQPYESPQHYGSALFVGARFFYCFKCKSI